MKIAGRPVRFSLSLLATTWAVACAGTERSGEVAAESTGDASAGGKGGGRAPAGAGGGRTDGDGGSGGGGSSNDIGGSRTSTGGAGAGVSAGGVAGSLADGGVAGPGGSGHAGGRGGAHEGGQDGSGRPCEGACCPTSAACYSTASGNGSPGSECLATRDNTARGRIQLRQQWARDTLPLGNTTSIVYGVLGGRTQLDWLECNQQGPLGSGGYLQLMDLDLTDPVLSKHVAYLGYATYVGAGDTASTVANGFCLGEEDYAGTAAYALGASDMSSAAGYPAGLPAPMPLGVAPWRVKPVKAKRRTTDFDLRTGRSALLAEIQALASGPEGFDGVFFLNEATGEIHGFAPLGWKVIYASAGAAHLAIPMREVETRARFNDKNAPNCVGAYRADQIAAPSCRATPDQSDPPWGCLDDSCAPGEAPAATNAYYLITEVEQVYAPELGTTLCVSFPTMGEMQAQGFYDPTLKGCRSAKWNPADPVNGLPAGDWCAKTNGPATADCHDAYRSHTFHAYAGAAVQEDTTCAF